MATTITKIPLSGSTDGRPIAVTATVISAANLLHTLSSSTNVIDEIWLWVSTRGGKGELTLTFGTTTTSNFINHVVHSKLEPELVTEGLPLRGASTPPTVGAFQTTGTFSIMGYVNRVTES